MTIQESIANTLANPRVYSKAESFSKGFRLDDLGNIQDGDEFIIPDDYVVIRQRIMRGGAPVRDSENNEVYAEFIKCMTSSGRIVHFFPTSLTKVAFRVDPETGKDVIGATRIVRTDGNLVDYVKAHPDMNATMQALKGCKVSYKLKEAVPVRAFGVSNDKATKESVQTNNVGTWNLAADSKKPENWTVG